MAEKLAEILGEMETGPAKAIKICKLVALWDRVVDDRVGRRTEAIKIRNKVLYILTSSPAWAQELSFLKSDIIEKFNREAGEEAIKDIRFKSG